MLSQAESTVRDLVSHANQHLEVCCVPPFFVIHLPLGRWFSCLNTSVRCRRIPRPKSDARNVVSFKKKKKEYAVPISAHHSTPVCTLFCLSFLLRPSPISPLHSTSWVLLSNWAADDGHDGGLSSAARGGGVWRDSRPGPAHSHHLAWCPLCIFLFRFLPFTSLHRCVCICMCGMTSDHPIFVNCLFSDL